MAALRVRGQPGPCLRRVLCAALVAVAIATPAVAAERIVVLVDEARILKLPDRAATVAIGNPLIADVSVQTGGVAVVTGKGYGMTNIVAMDRSGAVLMERNVQVEGPRGNVVFVYKGVDRETYSCTPKCEPRPTLGDAPAFFNPTLTEIGTRNAAAMASGTGGAPAPR
jgi:hypothetical protein